MRTRTPISTLLAGVALVAAVATPAGAGAQPTLLVQPNPAAPGATVEVTPLLMCFEGATGALVEVTGPENQTFTPTLVANDGRFDWRVEFTAGPAGVYTIDAECLYGQESEAYQTATLLVEGDPVTTTTSTTAAPGSTSTTAAPGSTSTTVAARPAPAAAVAASPRYTG